MNHYIYLRSKLCIVSRNNASISFHHMLIITLYLITKFQYQYNNHNNIIVLLILVQIVIVIIVIIVIVIIVIHKIQAAYMATFINNFGSRFLSHPDSTIYFQK